MDFGKSIGMIAAVAVGGLALYFFTRGKNGAAAADPGTGSITIGGETYEFPMTPGEHIVGPGGRPVAEEDLIPEYVPPTIYETQAPEADPLYQLGTPENPLYTEIPPTMIPHVSPTGGRPVSSWYEIREIEEKLGLTPAEYAAMMEKVAVTPAKDLSVAEMYGRGGYTMEQAESTVSFRDRVQIYGGDYVGGILVPPADFAGSVTAFAQYVRASMDR